MKNPKQHTIEDQVLDAEEMAIEAALARGEYVSDMTHKEVQEKWKDAVRNTLRKKPITVRVQERDIARIKVMALEQGIPYQTLVASILHRYATGALKGEA